MKLALNLNSVCVFGSKNKNVCKSYNVPLCEAVSLIIVLNVTNIYVQGPFIHLKKK